MSKRVFDFGVSFIGLLILSPFLILISFLIKVTSRGPVIFKQKRVGYQQEPFMIYKFRSMIEKQSDEQKNQLITRDGDMRITKIGFYLRKFKLDELPQLFNILKGDMSLVGPRPEVEKYIKYYKDDDLKIFSVKPGVTDIASVTYINEGTLLEKQKNMEDYYISSVLPLKLKLNLKYIQKASIWFDLYLIFLTGSVLLKKLYNSMKQVLIRG